MVTESNGKSRLEIVRPKIDHVEVRIDGKTVASATHDGEGWYADDDADDPMTVGARAVAHALASAERMRERDGAGATKPRLEIIRPDDDHVEAWVGGRLVHEHVGHRNSLEAAEKMAHAVARALGAEVADVAEPSVQLYRYHVSYFWTGDVSTGFASGFGSGWQDLTDAVEGPAGTDAMAAAVMQDKPEFTKIVILGFQLIDGPT